MREQLQYLSHSINRFNLERSDKALTLKTTYAIFLSIFS